MTIPLKREELILEIQEITLDVKNNLDCCYIILEYLEPKRNDNTWKLLSLIYPHFGYLYYLLRNHLQTSILLLKTILCPVNNFKTKEISPFNRTLKLSEESKKELLKISKEFDDKGLKKFRHTSIAHKSNLEHINTLKYCFRRGDKKILENTKYLYEKYEKWSISSLGEFRKIVSWRYKNEEGLKKIIEYIDIGLDKERKEFRKKVWPTFIKNMKRNQNDV